MRSAPAGGAGEGGRCVVAARPGHPQPLPIDATPWRELHARVRFVNMPIAELVSRLETAP
jgi:hypothetical protein